MRCNFGWGRWLAAAISVLAIQAQEPLPLEDSPHVQVAEKSAQRLWRASLVALSLANVADVHSSLGKRELNTALSGASGTLGTRGILLKSSFQGGLFGIEYLVLHSRSRTWAQPRSKWYRTLAIINFASSAALTGVAAHNYMIPRTRP